MARLIDESKLERVHDAAVNLIVQKGYGGASISSIAKEAQVSEGYLYRFYLGKEELVNVLLNSKIKEISDTIEMYLDKHENAEIIIKKLLISISDIGLVNPNHIKFLYVMLASYNFSVSEKIKNLLLEICLRIKSLAEEQNFIEKGMEIDHFFNMIIIYPIQYMNLRIKEFTRPGEFDENDRDSLIEFVLKTLSARSK